MIAWLSDSPASVTSGAAGDEAVAAVPDGPVVAGEGAPLVLLAPWWRAGERTIPDDSISRGRGAAAGGRAPAVLCRDHTDVTGQRLYATKAGWVAKLGNDARGGLQSDAFDGGQ